LRTELESLTGKDGKVSMEDVIDLAARRGYEVSAEDISGELDESQLDAVAGGAFKLDSEGLKLFKLDPETCRLSVLLQIRNVELVAGLDVVVDRAETRPPETVAAME
jgi:hypothetical protein